ncbi:hypothetical protein LWI29_027993 [Acer saccharum]|uniref:C2 domain-containing protein n=1 Tax=Acer saccharum TaxID=4024 RepID=A0AA39W467_ACESA|nr:hypothetical protein LWI29_027993 [Acer saccharum]
MGMCLSGDVRGGKQAVGGAQGRPTEAHNNNKIAGGGDGHNDAVDFFFRSRGLHALFTQIELSLSASKLRDRDITSKSDPMAVVYAKKREGTLEEIGRTEVVMNNLNPAWIVKVSIAYQFEIVQPLVFHVYDVDTKYHNVSVKMLKLNEQDFLGEASCFLSEIVTQQNRTSTLNLHDKELGFRETWGHSLSMLRKQLLLGVLLKYHSTVLSWQMWTCFPKVILS